MSGVDYLTVSRRQRVRALLDEFEEGLGPPPRPVVVVTVIGWAVLGYSVLASRFGWPS